MYYHIFSVKFGFMAVLFKKSHGRINRILLPQENNKNFKQLVQSAGGSKNGTSPVVAIF